jgi:hypothetical protein
MTSIAAARPPLPLISYSSDFSLAVWRATSTTAAPCAASTRELPPQPLTCTGDEDDLSLDIEQIGHETLRMWYARIDSDDFSRRKASGLIRGNEVG